MKKYPGRGGSKRCAEDFGVSQQQWSPWERGIRTPDDTRLDQIAKFFDVTAEYLWEGRGGIHDESSPAVSSDMPKPESFAAGDSDSSTLLDHFRCPFYSPPPPGQSPSGELRSMCWLVERIFDNLRHYGLTVRLHADDVDKVMKRYFQLKCPPQ